MTKTRNWKSKLAVQSKCRIHFNLSQEKVSLVQNDIPATKLTVKKTNKTHATSSCSTLLCSHSFELSTIFELYGAHTTSRLCPPCEVPNNVRAQLHSTAIEQVLRKVSIKKANTTPLPSLEKLKSYNKLSLQEEKGRSKGGEAGQ